MELNANVLVLFFTENIKIICYFLFYKNNILCCYYNLYTLNRKTKSNKKKYDGQTNKKRT